MTDKTLSSQNYLNPKTTAPIMTSTSTSSSRLNTAVKIRSATHTYQTPRFPQDSDSFSDNEETPVSSKKKVIYTPKAKEHAKQELTLAQKVLSNNSNNANNSISPASSSAYIHTVIKNNNNNQDGNDSKSASTLASTPSATSRRLETQDTKEKTEGQLPEFKFGKRKIQYLDDLDDPAYYTSDADDEFEEGVAEVDSETAEDSFEIRKPSKKCEFLETKRVKLNSDEKRRPLVSTVYLINSNGTKSYSFPVYRDCDLNVIEEWQNKLREADIDNDCETEQEILDYSIYQAKKDLVQGIQMQREEHTQLIKTAQKTGRSVYSQEIQQETAKRSEKPFEWNDQKVENKKQEDEGFFAKVSRNFKDLLGSSDKKK